LGGGRCGVANGPKLGGENKISTGIKKFHSGEVYQNLGLPGTGKEGLKKTKNDGGKEKVIDIGVQGPTR